MYHLAVIRDFKAKHYLIGGDWGPENDLHSHHYHIEVILGGKSLNEHGYLLDIVELEQHLEALVDEYRDATLNDQPEFEGLNPSLEHFSRIFARKLDDRLSADSYSEMTVKIWEDDIAWASYQLIIS